MNPKSFPKVLDSKTGCLRITIPENLDLALEGLIRKVLREQPKTDDIYAFAANYFETLLRIRDRAGVKYTATQLCPFHDDEEAREMIVLAGTFPRQIPGRARDKGPAPLKTKTKKERDKAEPEKGLSRSKETSKRSKPEAEKKQATPDLIKKLPLLAQGQGSKGEEEGREKAADVRPDRERTETDLVKEGGEEEEYVTSDPIKEFVEKELLTEGNSKTKEVGGQAEGGSAPLASSADAGENLGTADASGGLTCAAEDGETRKIHSETRLTDERGTEAGDVAKEEEDKVGDAERPEPEGGRPFQETQPKEEKENDEETTRFRAEEESQNKVESAPETETEADGIEAPLPPLPTSPGAKEKEAQGLIEEVAPSHAAADFSPLPESEKAAQSETSAETTSPQEREIAEIGGRQQPSEDQSEPDARPSIAPPMRSDEETPENSSLAADFCVSQPVENDDVPATETDKNQKTDGKEATSTGTETVARGEGGTERRESSSEIAGSPERAKGVREVGGASLEDEGFHPTKGGGTTKVRESQDAKAEDQNKLDHISTGAELTSASAVEPEDAAQQPETNPENTADIEDSTGEFGEEETIGPTGKLDLRATEILKREQASHSHASRSDGEAEPSRGDDERKAGEDKKLADEDVKAKDENLAEGPADPSPPEELPLQEADKARSAESGSTPLTGIPSTTEGPKGEDLADAEQEATTARSGSRGHDGISSEHGETPETESAGSQEIGAEGSPPAANEEASLPDEELCSVVDIDHVKREGALAVGSQEDSKSTESGPEVTAVGKTAPEPQGSPSPSLPPGDPIGGTRRENGEKNKASVQRDSEAKDSQATEGKEESEDPPDATDVREPVKPETDKEEGNFEEGTPEVFGPPAEEEKQIVIVEEPETTNENPEESAAPAEIQIKTIQTHYYDALRVPETVTREYRVHEMHASAIGGLAGAAFPPRPTLDEVQVPPGDGDVSSPAEAAEAESAAGSAGYARADALLAVDGSNRDVQASDPDDQPHPTTPASDVAPNLSELSLQEASEAFLINEKRFSSLEEGQIPLVTPGTDEARKGRSSRDVDEAADDKALSSAAGTCPRTPENSEEGGELSAGSSGGPPALSKGRDADGDSPILSVPQKPVPETRPPGEDESVQDEPRPLPGVNAEDASEQGQTESGFGEKESFISKTQERHVPESCPEEVQAESRQDGPTERTATGDASSAKTESTTAEVSRAYSARRDFASARSLSSARSPDLGKRNPLQRTRSLSTHRHGVADFEVWSTIEKELEEAATKIQSKFRGYKTRKKLRREVAVQISTEESSTRSTPVEADDADDRRRATGEFHDGIVLAEHPR